MERPCPLPPPNSVEALSVREVALLGPAPPTPLTRPLVLGLGRLLLVAPLPATTVPPVGPA